jgi:hypothetical protein
MIERLNKNPVFNNAILDDMIDTGLGRLTDMQNSDGGWGWWPGGTSNPYMTAYVVYGLAEAAKAGVAVDQDMVRRGAEFLAKRLANPAPASRYNFGEDDDNVRTWMVFALGVFDEGYLGSDKVRPVVDRVYEARDGLTDYSRAMLLMVLHKMGDAERTKRLVENLYNTVRIDPDSGTASWGQASNYWYWYDNGVEATAMVLRALLVAQPEHEYVPQAVNWLVRNRRGRRWYSTKDTAFAVYALADYLAVSKELSPRMTVDVTIDDRISRSFAVTPENALTFDAVMLVSPEVLTPGTHSVAITRTGTGNVYYAAYLDYFTREDPIPPAGNEVYVTREYYRLHPKQVEKTRRVWDAGKRRYVDEKYSDIDYDRERIEDGQALASGDLLDVELTLDARNNFEYMIVEDPKPAGCEPVKLVSGPDYAQAPFVNIEMRDRMTAFFATYLSQDKHTLSYRVRCETPGLFHALPTRVEAMYAPMVRSNGGSDKLTIEDQKAE